MNQSAFPVRALLEVERAVRRVGAATLVTVGIRVDFLVIVDIQIVMNSICVIAVIRQMTESASIGQTFFGIFRISGKHGVFEEGLEPSLPSRESTLFQLHQ